MRKSIAQGVAGALAVMLASVALAAPAPTPDEIPSLKGKRIGITVAGTEHYWDLKAYQGQIDEVKRLGGTPIALDGGRKDAQQIAQIQTLIALQQGPASWMQMIKHP